MKIGVVGLGYLGAVHAACMAKIGHDVVGIDTDQEKIQTLAAGRAPFYEPGLPQLLGPERSGGKLEFSTDYRALAGCEVVFLAVGTPQAPGSESADLTYIRAATAGAVQALQAQVEGGQRVLLVGKSTVPVGTAEALAATLPPGFSLIWNPEFLREGFAVKDTLQPDRIVYGLNREQADATWAIETLDQVYAPLEQTAPRLLTDYASAQIVKMAANGFLAMKVSFINAIADLCARSGGNVADVARAIGLDDRIGARFLRSGIGYGGGCLPKDARSLRHTGQAFAAQGIADLMGVVDQINLRQLDLLEERVVRLLAGGEGTAGQELAGKKITVLGLSFKPKSDDIRNSPSLIMARRLAARGAQITASDPVALEAICRSGQYGDFHLVEDVTAAVTGADLVLVLTEWDEYRHLDPASLARVVGQARIIDGRNYLDPAPWQAAGWDFGDIGRVPWNS